MAKKMGKTRESLDESLGRKLTFRFKGPGSRQVSQFWVRRTSMMSCSRVVRDACQKDPELRDFNEPDVDDIAGVFLLVRQFVHDDVVPIGPGEVVGCLSREATTYIHQMFRLYRFAIQYKMEELADRTIDEIQAHEFRCRGYLRMQWILDVYKSTPPESKLRLYCAASLYHSGIRSFEREFECHRASNFKMVRDEFPEVVDDIKRMAQVFRDRSTFSDGLKIVDHRNQKAFGMCVFHLHPHGKVCHAGSRIARQARSWGRGWGNWEMVRTDVEFPTVYPTDNGSDTESDDDPVDEKWEAIRSLDNIEETAAKTTKHTSPEFTDSAFSGGEEAVEETEETDATPSPSSSTIFASLLGGNASDGRGNKKELQAGSSQSLGGDVSNGESEKKKKQLLPTSSQLFGGDIGNRRFEKKQLQQTPSVMLKEPPAPTSPKNQAEDQLLNELLDSVSKTQAEDDESSKFFKEFSLKGLDRYFYKLTPQQFETQLSKEKHALTPPKSLPKPALRPSPQIFQPPVSDKAEVFSCKTCERTFARKQDFLKHISQKNKLCTLPHRKRSRSASLDDSTLTPLERIRRRPRLDYRYGD